MQSTSALGVRPCCLQLQLLVGTYSKPEGPCASLHTFSQGSSCEANPTFLGLLGPILAKAKFTMTQQVLCYCAYMGQSLYTLILLFPPNDSGRHTLLFPQSGLNCVLTKICSCPYPDTYESDLFWKLGLCTCNQIKMMSYGIRVGRRFNG